MFRLNVLASLIFLLALYSAAAAAQQLRVLSGAVVSATKTGSHDWYDIEADPDSSNNLIACGMKWDAFDNAYYGFVYASQDGGRIWHTALEDTRSRWVSEESCAFGVDGVAYFIAGASKVDNTGELHHEQGTTRIWVSHDSGLTWTVGATAGWADFSASVVDRNPGPNQNRLYIFFNSLLTYYRSIDDKGKPANLPDYTEKTNGFDAAGSTIGLISYKDGDTQVAGPVFDPEMYKLRLRGTYPSQNLLLKDGSLLTLFWSKRRNVQDDEKGNGRQFVFAAQHTDPQRKSVAEPVILRTSLDAPDWRCASRFSAPATYDPKTNTVYATYLDGSNGKCTLMLERSTDDGQTWISSRWTENPSSDGNDAKLPGHDYGGLAIARREDGMFALLWHDDKPDSWLVATSMDDGKTYSTPEPISMGKSGGTYRLTSESLDFHVIQANPEQPTNCAVLRIDNHTGGGLPHTNGIAVTKDGVLHPIWRGNGGQLYTASVAIIKPHDTSKPEPARTDGWQYEANRVTLTYGGSQRYDEQDGLLTETVVIRNAGITVLTGPLLLEITPSSRAGMIYPLDVVTEGSEERVGQYLDVGRYIPGDGLAPGASSSPIPLRFHFDPYSDAKQSGNVANVSLRLLTKGAK